MLYAYAAIMEDVPFANATPNTSVDTPALQELARQQNIPVAGQTSRAARR